MKRKLISMLMTLVMILSLVQVLPVSAASYTVGYEEDFNNLLNWKLSEATAISLKDGAIVTSGITDLFDAIADGNDVKNSKPAPDVFLKAAQKLGIAPADCMVVEDADAGVEAALNAGMDVLAVGYAKTNPKATYSADNLKEATLA